jgi:hypothetical protein
MNNAATTAPADEGDAPNTANRWKMDLRNHGSKFFNSLDDLICVVDKPEELFNMLHDIGSKHRGYEVKAEHILVNVCFSLSNHNQRMRLFLHSLGDCRWSQSHDGIRFTRQMDGSSTEILSETD